MMVLGLTDRRGASLLSDEGAGGSGDGTWSYTINAEFEALELVGASVILTHRRGRRHQECEALASRWRRTRHSERWSASPDNKFVP
jgi:hypothetical protein